MGFKSATRNERKERIREKSFTIFSAELTFTSKYLLPRRKSEQANIFSHRYLAILVAFGLISNIPVHAWA